MITAREAMEWAIQSGRSGDIEIGRFWLDVARELREEATSRRAWKAFEPTVPTPAPDTTEVIPVWNEPVPEGTRCEFCGYFLTAKDGQLVHVRTGQYTCPVGQPGPDDTIVHTFAKPE